MHTEDSTCCTLMYCALMLGCARIPVLQFGSGRTLFLNHY
ncbi:hypothetical protein M5D96_010765 [Drosophila gunungcola]|uniref:Uncharacterized protein n=1 Tax=Drosophila gunungcola TaxID=103775 RepID=A0A9P9YGC1_9MUSC|nr:hypothetical protein M5D96_010765 [Drosophila gunungcola]